MRKGEKMNKKLLLQQVRQREQRAQREQRSKMNGAVIAVALSRDKKIGAASATYAAQQSCPQSCPLLNKGCYAQKGRVGIHTARLNKNAAVVESTAAEIATVEAGKIRDLAKIHDPRNLRLHIVGDCPSRRAARTVARAARHFARSTGKVVWTYTHAWKTVPRRDWTGVEVLASVSNVEEAEQARAQGYAPAIIIVTFPNGSKAFQPEGSSIKFIPCPEQTGKSRNCQTCGLCFNTARLFEANMGIAFKKH
jgi:hypothetical protein